MKKRLLAACMAAAMVGSCVTASAASMSNFTKTQTYNNVFTDLQTGAWYYNNVVKAYELGLVNGQDANHFAPSGTMSVAATITLLARMHAKYYGNTVDSASGEWYSAYVKYLVQNKVIPSEYQTKTSNEMLEPITRYNFAQVLYNTLPSAEYPVINTVEKNGIVDLGTNTKGAAAVYALYQAGILTGDASTGAFQPNSAITRAETATILARVIDANTRQTMSPLMEKSFATQQITEEIKQTSAQNAVNAYFKSVYGSNYVSSQVQSVSDRNDGSFLVTALLKTKNAEDAKRLLTMINQGDGTAIIQTVITA